MAVTETDKLNRTNNVDISGAQAIVFDRSWAFNVNQIRGYIDLKVLENLQNIQNQQAQNQQSISQQAEFNIAVAVAGLVPLQYTINVNGDTYRELNLPSDIKLLVDIANFRASRRQCTFDLLIELKLPLAYQAPIRIFNDTVHFAVPTSGMVDEQMRNQLPNVSNFNIAELQRALSLATSTIN